VAPWANVDTVTVATAAGLLVYAGAGKLASGEPPAGLPRLLARPFGALEIAAGAAWLATGGRGPAAAIALLYGIFSVVVGRRVARGDTAGCGCLGGDERADGVHLAVNLTLAFAAIAAVAAPHSSPVAIAHAHPADAAGLGLLVVCAVSCTALVLSHLASAVKSYRPLRERA
jgi:hypothetical protein